MAVFAAERSALFPLGQPHQAERGDGPVPAAGPGRTQLPEAVRITRPGQGERELAGHPGLRQDSDRCPQQAFHQGGATGVAPGDEGEPGRVRGPPLVSRKRISSRERSSPRERSGVREGGTICEGDIVCEGHIVREGGGGREGGGLPERGGVQERDGLRGKSVRREKGVLRESSRAGGRGALRDSCGLAGFRKHPATPLRACVTSSALRWTTYGSY